MKIQKGIVKYKDRSDIICTYAVTDDGRQYYFLDENDEKKFANGNRIASTALVEAVDPMVKASNIGVMDPNGLEVVPFKNRSIRPINDDLILVEIANPVSSSVIESIQLKNDPLFATKLVSTPALIKDRLNQKMGPDARYVFNDQFSEATLYDINGNNLIGNQYYSFIALSNGKLYFSKNTIDSDIFEYSILPPEVQSNVTDVNMSSNLDVNQVNVNQNVIENALGNVFDSNANLANEVTNNSQNGMTMSNALGMDNAMGDITVSIGNEFVSNEVQNTNSFGNQNLFGGQFSQEVLDDTTPSDNLDSHINNAAIDQNSSMIDNDFSMDANVDNLSFGNMSVENNDISLPFESTPTNEMGDVSLPFESTPTNEMGDVSLPFESTPINEFGEVSLPFESTPTNEMGDVSLPFESTPTNEMSDVSLPFESTPTNEMSDVSLPFESTPINEFGEVSLPFESTPINEFGEVSLPFESTPTNEMGDISLPFESTPINEMSDVSLPFNDAIPSDLDDINPVKKEDTLVFSSEIVNQLLDSSYDTSNFSSENSVDENFSGELSKSEEDTNDIVIPTVYEDGYNEESFVETGKDILSQEISEETVEEVEESLPEEKVEKVIEESVSEKEEEEVEESLPKEKVEKVIEESVSEKEEEEVEENLPKEKVEKVIEESVSEEEEEEVEESLPKEKVEKVIEESLPKEKVTRKSRNNAGNKVMIKKKKSKLEKEEDVDVDDDEFSSSRDYDKDVDSYLDNDHLSENHSKFYSGDYEDDSYDEDIFKHPVEVNKLINEEDDFMVFDNKKYDEYKEDSSFHEQDSTMGDFVKSFSQLMNQNREQRKEIIQQDANIVKLKKDITKLNSSRKELLEDVNNLRQSNDSLSTRLRTSKDRITDLQVSNQKLEAKLHSLERAYEQISHEAESLRAKATRENGDMARLLADARALLGEEKNNYTYEDDDSYYRRVS